MGVITEEKVILVLGEGPTDELDDIRIIEAKYSINITKTKKAALHWN